MSKLEELARQRRLRRTEVNDETKTTKSASLLERLKSKKKESTNGVDTKTNRGDVVGEVEKPFSVVEKPRTSLGSKLQELRNRKRVEEKPLKDNKPTVVEKVDVTQTKEAKDWIDFENLVNTKRKFDEFKCDYELVDSTEFLTEHLQKRQKQNMLKENPKVYTVFYPSTKKDAELDSIKNFQNPSPDDIVMEAQEQVFKEVSNNVADLSLENSKATKKKKRNIKAESYVEPQLLRLENLKTEQNIFPFNVFMVGDKESGKSSILGNISYNMGITTIEDLRAIKRDIELMHHRRVDKLDTSLLNKSPYSWIIDNKVEERRIGKSSEVKSLDISYDDQNISLFELPSTLPSLKAMKTLNTKPSLVIIVISASNGEYEESMSLNSELRQKLLLLKGLGSDQFITVVNKMDTVDWDPERFLSIKNELTIVYKQLGFEVENMKWNATCSISDEGVTKGLPKNINIAIRNIASFTLLEALEKAKIYQFGNSISDLENQTSDVLSCQTTEVLISPLKFNNKRNNIVSGFVENGVLQPGEQLKFLPSNNTVIVKSMALMRPVHKLKYKSKIAYKGNWYEFVISSNDDEIDNNGTILVPSIKSTIKPHSTFRLYLSLPISLETSLKEGTYETYCNGAIFSLEITNFNLKFEDDFTIQLECTGSMVDKTSMLGFDRDIPTPKPILVFKDDSLLGYGEALPLLMT